MREPLDSAASAAEVFAACGGRWALVGALAALRYRATPRLTTDADFLADDEDVIVHKLIAWRPRDRNDIASILEAGIDLDNAYIRRWATEWQVLDRWEQARASR